MSEFQFQKSQRITIPAQVAGAEGVQGVVFSNTAFLGREPEYTVKWPSNDTVDQHGNFVSHEAVIAESVLLAGQPPKMVTAAEAQKMAGEAYDRGTLDVRNEAEIERQHRAHLRKASRKASARKRTRK